MQSLVVHLSADPDFRSFRVSVLIGRTGHPAHHPHPYVVTIARAESIVYPETVRPFGFRTGTVPSRHRQVEHSLYTSTSGICRSLAVLVHPSRSTSEDTCPYAFLFVCVFSSVVRLAANGIFIRFATGQFLFYDLFCRLNE
jgi:hypothetical protein